jgi:hypothetical protein
MDAIDAVKFTPSMIEDGVLTYRRTKSKVEAVIPLSSGRLKRLLKIPISSLNSREYPFRYKDSTDITDLKIWYRRLNAVLRACRGR